MTSLLCTFPTHSYLDGVQLVRGTEKGNRGVGWGGEGSDIVTFLSSNYHYGELLSLISHDA